MLGAEGYKQRQRGVLEFRLWLSRCASVDAALRAFSYRKDARMRPSLGRAAAQYYAHARVACARATALRIVALVHGGDAQHAQRPHSLLRMPVHSLWGNPARDFVVLHFPWWLHCAQGVSTCRVQSARVHCCVRAP